MPLRRIIGGGNHAFSPDDVELIAGAFEDTLQVLNLQHRESPTTVRITRCIIDLAMRPPARAKHRWGVGHSRETRRSAVL
jgi:hypothetical protein